MINKATMVTKEGLATVISEICAGIPERKSSIESMKGVGVSR